MRKSLILKAVAIGALVWALAGAAPAFAQTGAVSGHCTDDKGQAVVGYPIVIERQEVKGTYKTKTDKKGNYIYMGIPLGMYKVTIFDPAGKTLFYITKHVGLDPNPTPIDFDLAKEKAEATKAQESNPEFKKQQELQEKSAKEYAGLKGQFDQAQALFDQKKYPEAAAAFEQALTFTKEGDRNQLVLFQHIGDSYDGAHQYDKAVENYQKILAANPNDANAHNSLGHVYAEMGKVPEAQAEFQKAADLDPPNARQAYYNLGVVMYNMGKMDEAAAAFKKATDADPKYAAAFFMEGRALMGKLDMDPKTGKVIAPPGTAEALETYLKLEPNGQYANDAQQMLQTIQGSIQTEYKKTKKKG